MKKNIRSFVAGILTCLLFISFIPVARAVNEYICTVVSYPILINGTKYENSKNPALNHNGTTYVPLKGVLEAAGLTVAWNESLKQVEIVSESPEVISMPADETTKTMAQQARDGEIPETITTPDGVIANCLTDGYYISKTAFNDAYEETDYSLKARPVNGDPIWAIYKDNIIMLDNVEIKDYNWIEYDYYCDKILPLLN